MTNSPAIPQEIKEQSAEWLVRISSDDKTVEDENACIEWRNAHPDHERAFQLCTEAWDQLPTMTHLENLIQTDNIEQSGWFESVLTGLRAIFQQSAVQIATAVVATITLAILLYPGEDNIQVTDTATTVQHVTAVGEIKEISLADGSSVVLGPASTITVNYNRSKRRLSLAAGEAYFDVKKDPSRPFVVNAGTANVRVLGTTFDVRHSPSAVSVSVLEGIVEVGVGAEFPNALPPRRLTAGQEARAIHSQNNSGPPLDISVRNVKAADQAAWRDGRLVYIDAELRDIVADANRYADTHIELADNHLGTMRLTAVFSAGEIDAMVDTLVLALPVQAQRVDTSHIVIRANSQ